MNTGLTDSETQHRLGKAEPNELPEASLPSLRKLFVSQFTCVIVWVPIGASVVFGLLEDCSTR